MIITFLKRWYRYLIVKTAKNHANRMAKELNKTHYVLQIGGKMRVYQRWQINHLIKKNLLQPKLKDAMELKKAAVYVASPPGTK